jgi:hypothetical protein
MGVLGLAGGTYAGKELGRAVGSELVGDVAGSILGGLGALLPIGFETGGEVKKTGRALVHAGEFVLPVGVKPTKAQRKEVNKRKQEANQLRRMRTKSKAGQKQGAKTHIRHKRTQPTFV